MTPKRSHRRGVLAAVTSLCAGLTTPAQAHFQLLYTPESALRGGQETSLLMLFTHPAHGGPNMAMVQPESFYLVSQRGESSRLQCARPWVG